MIYFKIEEFLRTNHRGVNNTPDTTEHYDNLVRLVDNLLDPLRMKLGNPIIVTSGYRSKELNDLLIKEGKSASKTSQHMTGQAADIVCYDNRILFDLACTMDSWDQIIYEYGDDYAPDWVHISYVSKEKNRRQILRAVKKNGKTIYTNYTTNKK